MKHIIFCAVGVGFEPTIPCGMPLFESGALGHYATPPYCWASSAGLEPATFGSAIQCSIH